MHKVKRHQERVWALQILYGLDLLGELNQAQAERNIKDFKEMKGLNEEKYYFEELIEGVINKVNILNQLINQKAINWKVERMAYIDRNILRIAIFEIQQSLPIGVVINEAVELAKEYGDERSSAFINGILAKSR